MSWVRYLISGALILFVQFLLCEFVNIWPPLYIAIIPIFIILLPNELNSISLLLLSFTIGLLTDALSDGILGLNASACCAMAYFKAPIIKMVTKYYNTNQPNSKFSYLLISYIIFFIVYIILDGLHSNDYLFLLIRLAVNVVVNVVLAYTLERLWIRRLFS